MKKIDKDLLKINIEKAAQYDLDNNKVFGSAYCVIQGDEVAYENCFGYTSTVGKEPVEGNTMFRLASMTKPITAVATLILVERGLLSLEDRVTDYLPEFAHIHLKPLIGENQWVDQGVVKGEITILQLLTHTSGIGCEPQKTAKMTEEDKKTVDSTLRFYLREGLDFEPWTKQQYSGTGAFNVLVKIIEKVTGTDYPDFLQREIFDPCDMNDTTFAPSSAQWDRMIAMHNKIEGKNCDAKMKENCVFSDYPCTNHLGGAGLASTLDDYVKFAKMLLNKGGTPKKQILGEETFKLLHTPFVPEELMPSNERWGLGVRVIVKEEYKTLPVGTFGWSGAYGSHFWIDPENQIAAVFMKNSLFDGGAANESARNFEKAVSQSI